MAFKAIRIYEIADGSVHGHSIVEAGSEREKLILSDKEKCIIFKLIYEYQANSSFDKMQKACKFLNLDEYEPLKDSKTGEIFPGQFDEY